MYVSKAWASATSLAVQDSILMYFIPLATARAVMSQFITDLYNYRCNYTQYIYPRHFDIYFNLRHLLTDTGSLV